MLTIPVINCTDAETANAEIRKAAEFLPAGGWIHIDVSDGKFTETATWGHPSDLPPIKKLYPQLHFEVHLMVQDPENLIAGWMEAGADRIVIQFEAMKDPGFMLDIARNYGKEIMLGLIPSTPVENLIPYLSSFTSFQVLSVMPGPSGQKFIPGMESKVRFLQKYRPTALIEVDGGIVPEICSMLKDAGADAVTAATYIFGDPDPRQAYERLTNS